jgi:hypothetical protein
MAVVMINEYGERTLKVTRVRNQQPVQTFGSSGPNEPFRDPIRLRHLNRRAANDAAALGLKYRVETVGELAVVIPNQEPNRDGTLGDGPGHLPRLLRDPLVVRMRCAAGQMHPTTGDFDEEQHIQALQPDGVDRKEIHGHHAVRLRPQELTP